MGSYKYFERENANSKDRGPPNLIDLVMVKATGYSEHTVRRDVAEKSEISVAAFTSPPNPTKSIEK